MIEIFKAVKNNPIKHYQERITPLLNSAWLRLSYDAIDQSIAAIELGEPFLQPFADAAIQTGAETENPIKSETTAIWRSQNKIMDKPDLSAIAKLVKGQLAWVGNFGSNSQIAKEISAEYGRLWGEGKTRQEIVAGLRETHGNYTPKAYAEKFGEQRYFEMFTQHHSVLSGSFATLNRLRIRKTYRFWARNNERTCEICGFYHNKVFPTAGAIEEMDNYLAAAGTGDIEAMKAARPFVTDQESERPVAPLHIGCYCRMLANVDE